jgi:hypothetical protein
MTTGDSSMGSVMAMDRKSRGAAIMRKRVRVELERRGQASGSAFEDACEAAFAEALSASREEIVLWWPGMHLPIDEE